MTAVLQSRFLRAARGEPVDATPIWLMRQAGRYLPEYRAVRARVSFREMLHQPELAAEITLQPVRRFPLDAAIIFSDILTVTEAMGVPFEIVSSKGPVMARIIRTAADVASLRDVEPEADVPELLAAIRLVVADLAGRIPLIGFSGAPFTLACYLVEGGPSKDFLALRRLCYQAPDVAHALLDRIGTSVANLLHAQIEAGASAIQLFDTWASVLGPDLYDWFAAPASAAVLQKLEQRGVPRILYVGNTGAHLSSLRQAPAEVVSVDWRVALGSARRVLGDGAILQGNLDPCALYAAPDQLSKRIDDVLEQARGLRGHIFNLGHGIHPDVDPDQVGRLVDAVHARTSRAVAF